MMPMRVIPVAAFSALIIATNVEAVAPNQVCIYEYVNYVGGAKRCFELKPGMRNRQIPVLDVGIDKKTSSVQVGKNVKVRLYSERNYVSHLGDLTFSRPTIPPAWDNAISSLIIFPQGQYRPEGVELHRDMKHVGDCPLPEWSQDTEARCVTTVKPKSLWVTGKIQVTLYEHSNFTGERCTLPGAGYEYKKTTEIFALSSCQFEDRASSLVVRKITDPSPPERGSSSDKSTPVHRAPPAQKPSATPAPYPGQTGAIAPVPTMKPSVPLASLITGNTLKIRVGTQGVSWSIYFRPDNAVFARSNLGKEDSGKWWISGEVYCTQYQHLNNSKRSCYSLARVGDQLRVHKAADGQQVGLAEVMQGNPEQLDQPGSDASSQQPAPPLEATPIPLPIRR